LERTTVVEVILVTFVPGAMSPVTGASVIPTATPSVWFAGNFSVVGWATGVPDDGISEKWANGRFSVKVTDEGDPARACETITLGGVVFGFTSATVVPLVMEDPATGIPTVTPLTSAKCRTMRGSDAVGGWPSMVVAGELVASEKEKTGAVAGSPLDD